MNNVLKLTVVIAESQSQHILWARHFTMTNKIAHIICEVWPKQLKLLLLLFSKSDDLWFKTLVWKVQKRTVHEGVVKVKSLPQTKHHKMFWKLLTVLSCNHTNMQSHHLPTRRWLLHQLTLILTPPHMLTELLSSKNYSNLHFRPSICWQC